MHEMGLAQAIVDVVESVAGERTVHRVTVRIGARQAVAADSLAFSFELLTEGTRYAGATLDVVGVPGDEVRVDEIVLDDEVRRRPDREVVEAPHDEAEHPHRHPAWL